jgi:hypothetical protein
LITGKFLQNPNSMTKTKENPKNKIKILDFTGGYINSRESAEARKN